MKEIVGFGLFIFGGGAAANDPSLVAQIGRVGSGAAVAYRLVEIWMTAGASVRIEIYVIGNLFFTQRRGAFLLSFPPRN